MTARMTLLALRAAQEAGGSVRSYRVLPGKETLTREEATRHLAALPKPQRCDARQVGGTLEITCRSALEGPDFQRYRYQIEMLGRSGGIGRTLKRPRDVVGARALLIGAGE